MSSSRTLDLARFGVLVYSEDPGLLPALEAATEALTLTAAETWQEALRRIRQGDVAALVLRADDAETVVEHVAQAADLAPHLSSLVVVPEASLDALLPSLHSGLIEQVVSAEQAADHLAPALQSTLVRRALTESTRALVERLQAERAAAHRRAEGLQADLSAAQRRLDLLTLTDGVTGLYNRRHLRDQWRREVARARRYQLPLSILLVEAIGGAELPDGSLRALASFLVRAIRDVDFVARAGDRRFAVVLPHCGGEDVRNLAERLRASLAEESELTLALATAALGDDGQEPGVVLEAAERRLTVPAN